MTKNPGPATYFLTDYSLPASDSNRVIASQRQEYENTKNWLTTLKSAQEQCNKITDHPDIAEK